MGRAGNNDLGKLNFESAPPFWLRTDDRGEKPIDQTVIEVAEQNWLWAFLLVKKYLNDGARTPEIVEEVAVQVSSRLHADPKIGENLNGYFKTAVSRRVKTHAIRESRIAFNGGLRDLEECHQPQASDWTKVFEDRLALQSLLPHMPDAVRQILQYRILDFSWKQIGSIIGTTEKQAKSRFYYGVRQAHNELLAIQGRRALQKEDTDKWK
jgi:DNA-directed RNA polymerase specialized sigma24 family protein